MTPGTLDRYLAQRMLRPFAGVVVIVIMLLSLENTARLMGQLDDVEEPMTVLMRFMGYLLPEYLGVALIFALFIGVSLGFRGLALSGEFDVIAAIGLSPMRMLRVPIMMAIVSAALLLLTRGYLEPWGERQLDRFGAAIRAGELGVAIHADEFYSLSPDITFHAETMDRAKGLFVNVMVRNDGDILFARSARLLNGGSSGILLILADGQIVRNTGGNRYHVVDFAHARLPLARDLAVPASISARHRNARRSIDRLFELGFKTRASGEAAAASASFAARITFALLTLALPFLALALAIPPKRESGAIGIGVGIVLIILFIQIANAIEESAASTAVLEFALLLAAMTLAAVAAWRIHAVEGPGQIERKLQQWLAPVRLPLAALYGMARRNAEKPSR